MPARTTRCHRVSALGREPIQTALPSPARLHEQHARIVGLFIARGIGHRPIIELQYRRPLRPAQPAASDGRMYRTRTTLRPTNTSNAAVATFRSVVAAM
jgi:hypothetical protein